jgi:hypothetical protein
VSEATKATKRTKAFGAKADHDSADVPGMQASSHLSHLEYFALRAGAAKRKIKIRIKIMKRIKSKSKRKSTKPVSPWNKSLVDGSIT